MAESGSQLCSYYNQHEYMAGVQHSGAMLPNMDTQDQESQSWLLPSQSSESKPTGSNWQPWRLWFIHTVTGVASVLLFPISNLLLLSA